MIHLYGNDPHFGILFGFDNDVELNGAHHAGCGKQTHIPIKQTVNGNLPSFIGKNVGAKLTGLYEQESCAVITAEKDTDLWIIPAEVYQSIMAESAPVANYTNELMATRFSDVMWLIEQIMWKSLDKRVAAFLLEETSIEGTDTLKITHEIIANHLGSPREVITRMLKYFQNEGMVKLSRGTVEITDAEKLEELCEE